MRKRRRRAGLEKVGEIFIHGGYIPVELMMDAN
jgi:hypothetical protein